MGAETTPKRKFQGQRHGRVLVFLHNDEDAYVLVLKYDDGPSYGIEEWDRDETLWCYAIVDRAEYEAEVKRWQERIERSSIPEDEYDWFCDWLVDRAWGGGSRDFRTRKEAINRALGGS